MTKIYRRAYGIFACSGILFNHESPLRGLEFVTRKITNSVAKIKLGLQKELRLGNLKTRRDWGYAPEYVNAMWLMMQQKRPDDFVIATGETHSIQEFAQEAFAVVGLEWKDYLKSDERLFRPLDVESLCGNPKKAERILGWKPKVTFKELISIMVKADLERWEKYINGDIFPWDAPNYSSEIDIISRTASRREG
jgi:GDPmannose 4,6-dehydratase